MDNEFFPEGYKAPQGNYMKLQDGENTFRVLSLAVVGWEYWNAENKPVRSKTQIMGIPEDIRYEDGKPSPIKHFWAFCVWNYEAGRVQILEITQSTIQTAIKSYIGNKRWGSPKGYDLTVTRSGSGFDTEYVVMANPHSPLLKEAEEEYKARKINLDALFTGADPFDSKVIGLMPEDEVREHEKEIEIAESGLPKIPPTEEEIRLGAEPNI